MEDILTSDYANQFIEKIDKHELFLEDLKMLHESGYLKDIELFAELNVYCKRKNQHISNLLWLTSQSQEGAIALSNAMYEILDDATICKIWKQVSEEVYG